MAVLAIGRILLGIAVTACEPAPGPAALPTCFTVGFGGWLRVIGRVSCLTWAKSMNISGPVGGGTAKSSLPGADD